MALTKFTVDVNNIQALSDRPNEIDGLTSDQLKAKFDKAGADIKNFMNNILIEELEPRLLDGVKTPVYTDDSRLTNSRQCNNGFDNWSTARENLKINYGTSLPATADDGTIFFLYEE